MWERGEWTPLKETVERKKICSGKAGVEKKKSGKEKKIIPRARRQIFSAFRR